MKNTSKFLIAFFAFLFLAITSANAQGFLREWRQEGDSLKSSLKLSPANASLYDPVTSKWSETIALPDGNIEMELIKDGQVERLFIDFKDGKEILSYTIFPYYIEEMEGAYEDGETYIERSYKALLRNGQGTLGFINVQYSSRSGRHIFIQVGSFHTLFYVEGPVIETASIH